MRRGSQKYSQGIFTPKNPQKYVGKGKIIYRSSWEHAFMTFCDNNEHVLEWASEPIRIPYVNPLTGKKTTYVPDFLIRYRDKNNKIHTELIEIKPSDQSYLKENMTSQQRAVVALNHAKWKQAQKWCNKQGITFRLIHKEDIFAQSGKQNLRRR